MWFNVQVSLNMKQKLAIIVDPTLIIEVLAGNILLYLLLPPKSKKFLFQIFLLFYWNSYVWSQIEMWLLDPFLRLQNEIFTHLQTQFDCSETSVEVHWAQGFFANKMSNDLLQE